MQLSEKLLKEMSSWKPIEISGVYFHGCREDDIGVDFKNNKIWGPKWFSNKEQLAGNYAWSWQRKKDSKPFCLEVKLLNHITALERPEYFDLNAAWVEFLGECFPDIYGYDLIIKFQTSLL